VNESVTNIARGELREILFWSRVYRRGNIGYRFRISPGSFSRPTAARQKNYIERRLSWPGLAAADTVLDLYCGAGTIGLCSAAQAFHVVGIDIDEEAIQTARLNADVNGIGNARFYAGSIRK